MGAVVRFDSIVYLPTALQAEPNRGMEIPTAYVNPGLSSLSAYDPVSDNSVAFNLGCDQEAIVPSAALPLAGGYGEVISAEPSGNHAMGIFEKLTSIGGPIATLDAWNFSCSGSMKITADHPGPFSAGWNGATAYVVSGTLDQVKSSMRALVALNP